MAEIELSTSKLNDLGMVHDFGDVKKILRSFVDEKLDHRMILRKDDPFVKIIRDQGEEAFVLEDNPTAENIAKLIFDHAVAEGLPVERVRLWETSTSCAEYSV